MAGPVIKTETERHILQMHATGANVDAICDRLAMTTREVSEVLSRLSRYDRKESARVLERTPAGAAAAADHLPLAARNIEALLVLAVQSGIPAVVERAQRINAEVARLAVQLEHGQKEHALRARIASLREEIERASAELQAIQKANPVARAVAIPAADGGPSPAQIRVWAAANNVLCNSIGRVPREVREAYEAAHAAVPDG